MAGELYLMEMLTGQSLHDPLAQPPSAGQESEICFRADPQPFRLTTVVIISFAAVSTWEFIE